MTDVGKCHDIIGTHYEDVASLPILDVKEARFSNPQFNKYVDQHFTQEIHNYYTLGPNKRLYPKIFVKGQNMNIAYKFETLSNVAPPGIEGWGCGKEVLSTITKKKVHCKKETDKTTGETHAHREVETTTTYTLSVKYFYDIRKFASILDKLTGHVDDEVACAKQIGPIIQQDRYAVAGTTPQWYLGVIKRVIPDLGITDDTLFQEFSSFVQSFIHQHYHTIEYIEPSHEFLDTWLNDSKYTLAQKRDFRDAYDDYMTGIVDKELLCCNSFLKKEIYPEKKYGRVINSRSDQFKAVVAPYIKLVEEQVFSTDHFVKHHLPSFTAHRLVEIKEKFGSVVETDYSSFEGSFTQAFMQACELQLFKHILADNPLILDLITSSYNRPNKIVFKDRSSFTFIGSRMSGEMWTSLANGFSNAMLLEFCAFKSGAEVDYIVEGDDGFYGTTNSFDNTIVERLGFRLKIEEVNDINDCSFCGVKVDASGANTGDALKQLTNLGYTCDPGCLQPRAKKRRKFMLKAKMMSAKVIFGNSPIMHTCINRTLRKYANHHLVGNRKNILYKTFYWVQKLGLDGFLDEKEIQVQVSDSDRIIFENISNVHINEQTRIEHEIGQLDDDIFTIRALQ